MTAIRFRCPECGSTDGVVRDAFASWDEDTQEWVLSSVYDNFSCNECGANDIDPEEEEIEDEEQKEG